MGCSSCLIKDNEIEKEIVKLQISFRCLYETKENEEIQIINNGDDGDENCINKEIANKIIILKDNEKEPLVFKKKFDKIGLNTIDFMICEDLTDMSFMFNKCSCLKQIQFISLETKDVTNMKEIFSECNELEYIV